MISSNCIKWIQPLFVHPLDGGIFKIGLIVSRKIARFNRNFKPLKKNLSSQALKFNFLLYEIAKFYFISNFEEKNLWKLSGLWSEIKPMHKLMYKNLNYGDIFAFNFLKSRMKPLRRQFLKKKSFRLDVNFWKIKIILIFLSRPKAQPPNSPF